MHFSETASTGKSRATNFFFERTRNRNRSIATDDPFEKPQNRNKESEKDTATMMNQSAKSRYLRVGLVLSFVIFALFYFSPGGSRFQTSVETPQAPDTIRRPQPPASEFQGAPGAKPPIPVPESAQKPSSDKGSHGDGQVASDSTTGTTKCTKSSSKSKPIVQYVVMIDAGSTGSRVHVYRFNNCGDTPELEKEEFKMIQGGLSSYKERADDAAKSLDELMEVAMKDVPAKLRPCTPVAVKATAGLRMLGAELSDNILKAVRNRLETKYPFPVVKGDGVSIMDGKDEGVYAWITTNYLLGKIGGPDHSPTAAVLDLGGGSTQIVFEPTFPKAEHGGMPQKLAPGDHHYDLDFGGRQFDLYQHSHLGYGLMEARKTVHKEVVKAKFGDKPIDNSEPIVNPCIAPGMKRVVELDMKGDKNPVNFTMTGPTSGAGWQCRMYAEKILYKDHDCALAPCSFNGIHQPSMGKTFALEDVYIFSYFYDRAQPLGMPSSFTLEELKDVTTKVCAGKTSWGVFESVDGAMTELDGRPEYCLDLSFQFALLHTGYDMPLQREVKIAKKIKGNELGWCLGASLPLLSRESGWTCKFQEV